MDTEHCIHDFTTLFYMGGVGMPGPVDLCAKCGAQRPADIVIDVANTPGMYSEALQPEGSN